MTTLFLLDTNTSSYAIKGNMSGVRERLEQTPMPQVGISTVTEAELRFGVARKSGALHLKKLVDEFLIRMNIFAWDSRAAHEYARVRAEVEASGKPIGNLDLMIAAHALALDATLVTHDLVFARITHLRAVDWVK